MQHTDLLGGEPEFPAKEKLVGHSLGGGLATALKRVLDRHSVAGSTWNQGDAQLSCFAKLELQYTGPVAAAEELG
jgi:hypothetical protein